MARTHLQFLGTIERTRQVFCPESLSPPILLYGLLTVQCEGWCQPIWQSPLGLSYVFSVFFPPPGRPAVQQCRCQLMIISTAAY